MVLLFSNKSSILRMPTRSFGQEPQPHSQMLDDTGIIDETIDYSKNQLEELLKKDADTISTEIGVPEKAVDPHLKTLDSSELIRVINDLKDDPNAIALERRLQDQKSTIPNPKLVIIDDELANSRNSNTRDGDPLETISIDELKMGPNGILMGREREQIVTNERYILPSLRTKLETQSNYLNLLYAERYLPENKRERVESDLRSDAALDEQIRFFRDVFIPRTRDEIDAAMIVEQQIKDKTENDKKLAA